MRLTELEIGEEDKVLVDAEFDNFGLLSSSFGESILAYLDNEDFLFQLENKKIRCLICKKECVNKLPDHIQGVIVSENPMLLFWKLHNKVGNCRKQHATKIGINCAISPLASIALNNVIIGDNVVIEEFVSIKENVYIGNNVIIRSGSIIGGSGFEVKRLNDGILSVNHFGAVVIEDNVEIQQLVSVEKSVFSWDSTIIGANTKLADMVLIAHGCKVGRKCLVSVKSTICGSVNLKDDVWVGPDVTIKNGLTIGKSAYIALGSIVRKSVGERMALINDKMVTVSKFNAICSNHKGAMSQSL